MRLYRREAISHHCQTCDLTDGKNLPLSGMYQVPKTLSPALPGFLITEHGREIMSYLVLLSNGGRYRRKTVSIATKCLTLAPPSPTVYLYRREVGVYISYYYQMCGLLPTENSPHRYQKVPDRNDKKKLPRRCRREICGGAAFTLHATRRTLPVTILAAWCVLRPGIARGMRDARVYGHTTTAMH